MGIFERFLVDIDIVGMTELELVAYTMQLELNMKVLAQQGYRILLFSSKT